MSKNQNEWLCDYQEFVNADVSRVPEKLNGDVYAKVICLLKPNAWQVFLKLLGIHFVTGFLSLSVCHQFGLNPFNTEISLADWLMKVGGHHICMLGCGVTFVSVTILSAGYFFTMEESRALNKNNLLQNLSLGVISLGLFAAFGAELTIGVAALWMLGGLVGGVVASTAVFRLKMVVAT